MSCTKSGCTSRCAAHRAAVLRLRLEHEHVPAGVGEQVRGDQAVGPAADDDGVGVHRPLTPVRAAAAGQRRWSAGRWAVAHFIIGWMRSFWAASWSPWKTAVNMPRRLSSLSALLTQAFIAAGTCRCCPIAFCIIPRTSVQSKSTSVADLASPGDIFTLGDVLAWPCCPW